MARLAQPSARIACQQDEKNFVLGFTLQAIGIPGDKG